MRIPVSVSSVKRAEAGKRVLYRTLSNLADYFQVSPDTLLPNTPIPTWLYKHLSEQKSAPCYGREWELQQLHTLLNNAERQRKSKTTYVHGMIGMGKSNLVDTFLNHLKAAKKRTLKFTTSTNPTQSIDHFSVSMLIQQLLLTDLNDELALRNKMHLVFSSPIGCLRASQLVGLTLNQHQWTTIKRLSSSRLQEVDRLIAKDLLSYATHKKLSVIVLDGAHLLSHIDIEFIRTFIQYEYAYPILFIISAQEVGNFTNVPDWLSLAHTIRLKPIDTLSSNKLANTFLLTQGLCPIKNRFRIESSIERACGNPSFLKQLLFAPFPETSDPEALQQVISTLLSEMPEQLVKLLRFVSLIGIFFNTEQIQLFSCHANIKSPLCIQQRMLHSGLVIQSSPDYKFIHPLVRDVIKNTISENEIDWYKQLLIDKTQHVNRI